MSKRKSTRREFNKKLALVAAAPLGVVAAESAGVAAPAQEQPTPGEVYARSAQALTDIVRLRHGKHLSEEQLKRIRSRLESSLRTGAALRRFPLTNADEPAFTFSADVPI
jgi:hypothetical protein